jgi:RNA polymerase sigma-70 factor (ECF subfamily)
MPVMSPSLHELLPKATSGDEGAMRLLVTALLPRVRNLVRYLVWRDSDVDDLTQESLLVVLDGLESFRGEGRFEVWVDRVVVRSVFRNLKRLRTEPSRVDSHEPFDGADLVAPVPLPDDYLTRRQTVAVLDRLSPEQRHVLVLHHVLDMTVPEMAEQLKLPLETVRSRLRLARHNLREQNLGREASPSTKEPS